MITILYLNTGPWKNLRRPNCIREILEHLFYFWQISVQTLRFRFPAWPVKKLPILRTLKSTNQTNLDKVRKDLKLKSVSDILYNFFTYFFQHLPGSGKHLILDDIMSWNLPSNCCSSKYSSMYDGKFPGYVKSVPNESHRSLTCVPNFLLKFSTTIKMIYNHLYFYNNI